MNVIPLEIPEVLCIEPRVFEDARGEFFEAWSERDFAEHVMHETFVQDNVSRSVRGVLRGLHYQLVQPQGKLVRCTQGTVFDVAVDIRRSSSTFGQWVGAELSEANRRALWVPPGFAHGFVTLSETSVFQYKCTAYYAPEFDRTIKWDDPVLGIEWPEIGASSGVLVSEKDQRGASFEAAEVFA